MCMKTSKTEQKIIDTVRSANDLGALAGLADDKFVSRLAEAGMIVYVKSTSIGAGWAIVGHHIAAGK